MIDKPGKGSFHGTTFGAELQQRGITALIVAGVTTEVCVHTTVREANDRGYECLVLSDCTGSYFPEFHQAAGCATWTRSRRRLSEWSRGGAQMA